MMSKQFCRKAGGILGSYLNPGSAAFCNSLRSKIYIDKSALIARINELICTEQRFVCVSRPRRFGKSMAANMLAAYYEREEEASGLFDHLQIHKYESYKDHINKYNVIKINMQEFLSVTSSIDEMLARLRKYVLFDLLDIYPELRFRDPDDLIQVMKDIFSKTRCPFVILIDEWDCLFREYKYLSYHWPDKTVYIPNKEVSQEYINAISTMEWHEVIDSVENSRKLLEALWAMDSETVARGVDRVHREISVLQYNDENSLSCTINLAFYFAREYYTIIRELSAGKGFADICFLPRKLHQDKPAAIIELKWDKSAKGAIDQIRNRQYGDALSDYQGELLLVGINYDKKTKMHDCVIEKYRKD